MTPKRIQLKRTKGWRKPEGAIVVSRPTKWGNPFVLGGPTPPVAHHLGVTCDSIETVLASYRIYINSIKWVPIKPEARPYHGLYTYGAEPLARHARRHLRGHDLACWCPLDQPCHADVLLEIANTA